MKNYQYRTFLVLLTTFFLNCSNSFAQLTSFTPTYVTQSDSLSGETTLHLSITFNDISDLGGIQVSIYDAESGRFIYEVAGTRDELSTNGMLLTDHVLIPFLYIESGHQYRFDINPYTLVGSFIEHLELTTSL